MSLVKSTLSNEELIAKCREWISKLCKSGGKDWRLTVPPIIDRDPDFLFTELCDRLEQSSPSSSAGVWVRASERLPEKREVYHVKVLHKNDRPDPDNILKDTRIFDPTAGWDTRLEDSWYSVIEWLDESPQKQ